jgi:hypothetical protein
VLFGAGRAALEVSAHRRYQQVDVVAGERRLDVDVDQLKAVIAGQLRAGRPQQPPQEPRSL